MYTSLPLTLIRMTLSFVLEKLESSGSLHKIVINNSDYRKIDTALTKFESLIASSEVPIYFSGICSNLFYFSERGEPESSHIPYQFLE
jgi:hypothetical protein